MSRPRGFVDWRPQAKTRVLLEQVEAVLEEYRSYLPMTCRQIFYRLVGAHGYAKTEAAYESLGNMLVMARRSSRISFSAIRDDGVTEQRAWGYVSVGGFWTSALSGARSFRFLRQAGQTQYVECWVEAAGMVPLVARTVEGYGVDVYSCGGFDSLTFKHKAAQRVAWRDVPTIVLHVGDHDPSGVALYQAVAEDVEAMVYEMGGEVKFDRIAVTPEQVRRYSLPTAPAKSTDKRSAWLGGGTVQVEAFPPDVLATEVRQAVESWVDLDAHRALLVREGQARAEIDVKMRELRGMLEELYDAPADTELP
jgi:hypothetical protein